jgi:hypothetical protein
LERLKAKLEKEQDEIIALYLKDLKTDPQARRHFLDKHWPNAKQKIDVVHKTYVLKIVAPAPPAIDITGPNGADTSPSNDET